MSDRKLRIFICHASQDKPIVRELYQKLLAEGWIDPWLDEEKLLPGHDWSLEIEKAVHDADVVIVFLSMNSVDKRGFVQKELKFALDVALEMPEGSIFIIPLRLDGCDIPSRLSRWQWIDYFPKAQIRHSYMRLQKSLDIRAGTLGIQIIELRPSNEYTTGGHQIYKIGGLDFVKVPRGKFLMGSDRIQDSWPRHLVDIPYDYWIGRYPITNKTIGMSNRTEYKPLHPAVQVSWYDAQEFVLRMKQEHGSQLPRGLNFRLPSEAEWKKTARGLDGREWPWGNHFVYNVCNTSESHKFRTTSIGDFLPFGESPFGATDMAGNIWEWTRTLWGDNNARSEYKYPYQYKDGREDESAPASYLRIVRGGSFMDPRRFARCAFRSRREPGIKHKYLGFRIAIVPTSLINIKNAYH